MSQLHRVLLFSCLVLVLSAARATGAGFALYEWDARGTAMGGGAVVASPKGPSAVASNPAAMTALPGVRTQAGVTLITPVTTIEERGTGRDQTTDYQIWAPPHAYLTAQMNDDWWFGVGVFSRFGLGNRYDDDWFGRYNVYEVHIKTASLNPNLAYKINDQLAVAAGVEAMYFEFDQKKKVNLGFADLSTKLSGDTTGFGWNVALYYTPLEWLRFGAQYRSRVEQDVDGMLEPGDRPAGLPPALAPNTKASGRILLPDSLTAAVSVNPIEKLTTEFAVTWTHWSTYKELRIEFDQPFLGRTSSVSEKDWHDVYRFMFGAEYALTDWLDLRAGYTYDQSPINGEYADYLVPANDRQIFSGGVGLHEGAWSVDFSYSYLWIKGREIDARPADGVFASRFKDGHSHLIGLTVGYEF